MGNWDILLLSMIVGFLMILGVAPVMYLRREKRRNQPRHRRSKKHPRRTLDETYLEIMDLEFCPGMTWLADTLMDQRRELQRQCGRFAKIRSRCSDARVNVMVQAFEAVDEQLDANIHDIISAMIAAGYRAESGIYQPHFRKNKVNRELLRDRLVDNQDCLAKLDQLINLAVELSSKERFTQIELDAWIHVFDQATKEDLEEFDIKVA